MPRFAAMIQGRFAGRQRLVGGILLAALAFLGAGMLVFAQEFPKPGEDADAPELAPMREKMPEPVFGPPPGATPLSKTDRVWMDLKRKQVIVDGYVTLREGPPIEMFACPIGSKEHESIIATYARPSVVHAGLLAVGAVEGHPVKVDPEYVPATGTRIDILVMWKDEHGRTHKAPAQNWVQNIATGKPLEHSWVFAGSGFWVDEETMQKVYYGDSGDFICVSNFPTATLDLPIPSSQANTDLMFQAFTKNIPPRGTGVRMILIPRPEPSKEAKEPPKTAPEREEKPAPKLEPAAESPAVPSEQ